MRLSDPLSSSSRRCFALLSLSAGCLTAPKASLPRANSRADRVACIGDSITADRDCPIRRSPIPPSWGNGSPAARGAELRGRRCHPPSTAIIRTQTRRNSRPLARIVPGRRHRPRTNDRSPTTGGFGTPSSATRTRWCARFSPPQPAHGTSAPRRQSTGIAGHLRRVGRGRSRPESGGFGTRWLAAGGSADRVLHPRVFPGRRGSDAPARPAWRRGWPPSGVDDRRRSPVPGGRTELPFEDQVMGRVHSRRQ
jgi:hypothetical protein